MLISYRDAHEDYYHAFMAGLFNMAGYENRSNKEEGNGLPDLQIIDNIHNRAAVMEFKYCRNSCGKSLSAQEERDRLERAAGEGCQQINDAKYAATLFAASTTVLCYGVAFYQKQCFVMDTYPENTKKQKKNDTADTDQTVLDTTVKNIRTLIETTGQDVNAVIEMLLKKG